MKNEKKIKSRPSLSWQIEDYQVLGIEVPECLYFGRTEGEAMTENEIISWVNEETQALSVLKEEYPHKFEEHYQYFVLNLEYLNKIGKITKSELNLLKKRSNFNF